MCVAAAPWWWCRPFVEGRKVIPREDIGGTHQLCKDMFVYSKVSIHSPVKHACEIKIFFDANVPRAMQFLGRRAGPVKPRYPILSRDC